MDTIKLWARNGDAVRQAIELGELVHLDTASEELTDEFLLFAIDLPIRPINFQYPEFPAVGREKYPTPAVAGFPPATLTKVSADAGFPLRRHSL